MKNLLLLFLIIFSTGILAQEIENNEKQTQEEYIKGRILYLESTKKSGYNGQDGIKEIEEYRVRILEGEDENKEILIQSPVYLEKAYNIFIRENENVVLYKEHGELGDNTYYIVDIDKRDSIFLIVGIFVLLTVIIARYKGIKAILSLVIVVGIIYNIFLPMISNGYSPILISTLCALLCSTITIFLTTGFSQKGLVAILGAVSGVVIAGIVSMYFSYKMAMTGFVSVEALNYSTLLQGIKIREIISAGVILGSMGAVMDVSMSISSALTELRKRSADITKKDIFESGMRIGEDIIGTMVNTLILAYIGSGILSTLFIYLQKEQFPLIRILNFESVAADIIRAFAGSIGILVAVPITSYLCCIIFTKKIAEFQLFFIVLWEQSG
ncbi:YibE/F family protein [Cetobacterium somerae ATCC BAA-474]|uniref:YibE/F family protein n=1 Tax=Cetobacterium somerae TaxID=188913 RepID=UPI003CC5243A